MSRIILAPFSTIDRFTTTKPGCLSYLSMGKARAEFAEAARSHDKKLITETVARGVGGGLAGRAARRRQSPATSSLLRAATVPPAGAGLSFPDKGRVPTKPKGFGAIK
jgi:hypothetical protein